MNNKTTKRTSRPDFLNPEHAYFAISHTAARRLEELGVLTAGKTTHENLKRLLVPVIADTAEIVKGTVETHFLATIKAKHVEFPVTLVCVVTKGSPADMQPYTLMVRGAMSSERTDDILASGKGLTGLKFDDGVARVGFGKRSKEFDELQREAKEFVCKMFQDRDLVNQYKINKVEKTNLIIMSKMIKYYSELPNQIDWTRSQVRALEWAIYLILSNAPKQDVVSVSGKRETVYRCANCEAIYLKKVTACGCLSDAQSFRECVLIDEGAK